MINNRKILLLTIFIFSVLIAVLNSLAGQFFWYWKFWWFDILMHLMGGFTISLFTIYIYKIIPIKKIKLISLILISVIIIAISWEIFEFAIKQSIYEEDYFLDTVTDIFMAIISALFTYKIFSRSKASQEEVFLQKE